MAAHSSRPPAREDIRVLFVGFNALAGHDLSLGEEIAALEGELNAAHMPSGLPMEAIEAGSTDALHGALLAAPRVQVLHFSAHGHSVKGLLLLNADGRRVLADGGQLATVLGRFRNLRLIVLAACHQKQQAEALKDIFDCIVATDGQVPVDASRQFMQAFYKGLASGDPVATAFETAKARIAIDAPEAKAQFWLVHRDAIRPEWIRLDPVHGRGVTEDELDAMDDWLRSTVNSNDDVIITANVKRWQAAVPCKPSAAPHVIDIPVPERQGGWQRHWPLDRGEWGQVAAQIAKAAQTVQRGDWIRVHVVVNLPYSLAALLACALEAQNHQLIFYQWSPPPKDAQAQRTWQAWGPGADEAMPPPDDTPYFSQIDWPDRPMRFDGDIALTVGVSRPIASDLVYAAAGDPSRIRIFQLVPTDGAGQASLDQRRIKRAAAQFAEALDMAGARFPHAKAIHLFVCAPKALLMRAATRLATSPVPVIVHEFFEVKALEPSRFYLPMVDLKEASVVKG